jgi:hypothetical protein
MCDDKKDCDCKDKHHGHHGSHHALGYSTILKRTSKTVEVPVELLEVAEIEKGDFVRISIMKVLKPSEKRKMYHHKKK